MALPPERITVKRRREEEPVDALYIPPRKLHRTVVWRRIGDDGHEIGESEGSDSTRKFEEGFRRQHPQVPNVKTTCPSATTDHSQNGTTTFVEHNFLNDVCQKSVDRVEEPRKLSPPPQDAPSWLLNGPAKEPRKFHFTRSASPSRSLSVLNSGIRKVKKKQKKDFALFVERTHGSKCSKHSGKPVHTMNKHPKNNGTGLQNGTAEALTSRKRPLASAAEQQWRKQTWSQPPKRTAKACPEGSESRDTSTFTDPAHDVSMGLAQQLQQFALEATQGSNRMSNARKGGVAKVKPKPPKPRLTRQRSAQREDDCDNAEDHMDCSSDDNNADCFVYDVYIRQAEPTDCKASNGSVANGPDGPKPDKVGILVIEDEDQEEWELYREEDQSSDDDWNSEEDDENAEDFYGNDYPEEELDSDDEYDKDTYKHWQGSFDDEEMDSQCWSDDDFRTKCS
ncbi:MAG: hypothetical protein Q9183_000194 [Haloplaca sp. 2 TL-2023]